MRGKTSLKTVQNRYNGICLCLFLLCLCASLSGCDWIKEKSRLLPVTEPARPYKFAAVSDRAFFAVIGDYGTGMTKEAEVAELIQRQNPDFIITVGDNNYPRGCMETIDRTIGQYFHSYIYRYKGRFGQGSSTPRFFPTLGNHDWLALNPLYCADNSAGTLPYLAYFTLPGNERFYEFQWGPVHFFALDSQDIDPSGNTVLSDQYRWFVAALKQSKAPFKVAYFHHPPYSSGLHHDTKAMQWQFQDLGIDLVLSGHEHHYERLEKGGVPHLIIGASGQHLRRTRKKRHPDSKIIFDAGDGLYGALFVSANRQVMGVQFRSIDNIIRDAVTINAKTSKGALPL